MADCTIALLCMLHPASQQKQTRCLDLLRKSAREYYTKPEANCTTWSYNIPAPLLKSSTLTVCGLEIYTTKQAFTAQLNDPVYFQSYRTTVERESIYEKPAEHTAWYHAIGFVAREATAEPFGNVLVSTTHFVCRDRDKALEEMRRFAPWVKENEPGVLTYAYFTRPKAANEVFLFVRYKDKRAMIGHDRAPEHLSIRMLLRELSSISREASATRLPSGKKSKTALFRISLVAKDNQDPDFEDAKGETG